MQAMFSAIAVPIATTIATISNITAPHFSGKTSNDLPKNEQTKERGMKI